MLIPTSEEIGILDTKTAAQLKRLKEIVPPVRFESFLGCEEIHADCGPAEKKWLSIQPLQINIYGPQKYLNEVGSILSDAGMFLQEPFYLDKVTVYRNPHFLSWDDTPTTPRLLGSKNTARTDFATKVEAILDSSNDVLRSTNLEQDFRISTRLKRFHPHHLRSKQLLTSVANCLGIK